MGSRRLVVSAWAAVSLWSATARADQDVELESLVVREMFGPGGGFDFSINRVWRDDGTATRIQGGFIGSVGRRGFSLCFGWEERLISRTITINLALMTLPDL